MPVDLYVNPDALARAFIVHQWVPAASPEQAIRRLVTSDFDPRREAVVEAVLDASEAVGASEASEVSDNGTDQTTARNLRLHL